MSLNNLVNFRKLSLIMKLKLEKLAIVFAAALGLTGCATQSTPTQTMQTQWSQLSEQQKCKLACCKCAHCMQKHHGHKHHAKHHAKHYIKHNCPMEDMMSNQQGTSGFSNGTTMQQ
jgi:hypothetical protein